MVYSTDRSKAMVPVLVLLFVALWFILRGDLFYVLPCVILFLCFCFFFFFFFFFVFVFFFFFSPFSIAITSLVEKRAKLSTFRTFVRFLPVWICRFPLPLSVWEKLRFVIVTLLGLFSYLFFSNLIKLRVCPTVQFHRSL